MTDAQIQDLVRRARHLAENAIAYDTYHLKKHLESMANALEALQKERDEANRDWSALYKDKHVQMGVARDIGYERGLRDGERAGLEKAAKLFDAAYGSFNMDGSQNWSASFPTDTSNKIRALIPQEQSDGDKV